VGDNTTAGGNGGALGTGRCPLGRRKWCGGKAVLQVEAADHLAHPARVELMGTGNQLRNNHRRGKWRRWKLIQITDQV